MGLCLSDRCRVADAETTTGRRLGSSSKDCHSDQAKLKVASCGANTGSSQVKRQSSAPADRQSDLLQSASQQPTTRVLFGATSTRARPLSHTKTQSVSMSLSPSLSQFCAAPSSTGAVSGSRRLPATPSVPARSPALSSAAAANRIIGASHSHVFGGQQQEQRHEQQHEQQHKQQHEQQDELQQPQRQRSSRLPSTSTPVTAPSNGHDIDLNGADSNNKTSTSKPSSWHALLPRYIPSHVRSRALSHSLVGLVDMNDLRSTLIVWESAVCGFTPGFYAWQQAQPVLTSSRPDLCRQIDTAWAAPGSPGVFWTQTFSAYLERQLPESALNQVCRPSNRARDVLAFVQWFTFTLHTLMNNAVLNQPLWVRRCATVLGNPVYGKQLCQELERIARFNNALGVTHKVYSVLGSALLHVMDVQFGVNGEGVASDVLYSPRVRYVLVVVWTIMLQIMLPVQVHGDKLRPEDRHCPQALLRPFGSSRRRRVIAASKGLPSKHPSKRPRSHPPTHNRTRRNGSVPATSGTTSESYGSPISNYRPSSRVPSRRRSQSMSASASNRQRQYAALAGIAHY
eukprot:TRINITY_DN65445_c1_g3_i5.p1 TRINITY_DN65445_c1_g3~~TRINITY_DN65445_c1_g3_i5.p1  ORF type:complete len:569 (+),score=141.25 TRINITY_DN65445_c1_g3_i5:122-1828(+)